jgi:hypothetical protein
MLGRMTAAEALDGVNLGESTLDDIHDAMRRANAAAARLAHMLSRVLAANAATASPLTPALHSDDVGSTAALSAADRRSALLRRVSSVGATAASVSPAHAPAAPAGAGVATHSPYAPNPVDSLLPGAISVARGTATALSEQALEVAEVMLAAIASSGHPYWTEPTRRRFTHVSETLLPVLATLASCTHPAQGRRSGLLSASASHQQPEPLHRRVAALLFRELQRMTAADPHYLRPMVQMLLDNASAQAALDADAAGCAEEHREAWSIPAAPTPGIFAEAVRLAGELAAAEQWPALSQALGFLGTVCFYKRAGWRGNVARSHVCDAGGFALVARVLQVVHRKTQSLFEVAGPAGAADFVCRASEEAVAQLHELQDVEAAAAGLLLGLSHAYPLQQLDVAFAALGVAAEPPRGADPVATEVAGSDATAAYATVARVVAGGDEPAAARPAATTAVSAAAPTRAVIRGSALLRAMSGAGDEKEAEPEDDEFSAAYGPFGGKAPDRRETSRGRLALPPPAGPRADAEDDSALPPQTVDVLRAYQALAHVHPRPWDRPEVGEDFEREYDNKLQLAWVARLAYPPHVAGLALSVVRLRGLLAEVEPLVPGAVGAASASKSPKDTTAPCLAAARSALPRLLVAVEHAHDRVSALYAFYVDRDVDSNVWEDARVLLMALEAPQLWLQLLRLPLRALVRAAGLPATCAADIELFAAQALGKLLEPVLGACRAADVRCRLPDESAVDLAARTEALRYQAYRRAPPTPLELVGPGAAAERLAEADTNGSRAHFGRPAAAGFLGTDSTASPAETTVPALTAASPSAAAAATGRGAAAAVGKPPVDAIAAATNAEERDESCRVVDDTLTSSRLRPLARAMASAVMAAAVRGLAAAIADHSAAQAHGASAGTLDASSHLAAAAARLERAMQAVKAAADAVDCAFRFLAQFGWGQNVAAYVVSVLLKDAPALKLEAPPPALGDPAAGFMSLFGQLTALVLLCPRTPASGEAQGEVLSLLNTILKAPASKLLQEHLPAFCCAPVDGCGMPDRALPSGYCACDPAVVAAGAGPGAAAVVVSGVATMPALQALLCTLVGNPEADPASDIVKALGGLARRWTPARLALQQCGGLARDLLRTAEWAASQGLRRQDDAFGAVANLLHGLPRAAAAVVGADRSAALLTPARPLLSSLSSAAVPPLLNSWALQVADDRCPMGVLAAATAMSVDPVFCAAWFGGSGRVCSRENIAAAGNMWDRLLKLACHDDDHSFIAPRLRFLSRLASNACANYPPALAALVEGKQRSAAERETAPRSKHNASSWMFRRLAALLTLPYRLGMEFDPSRFNEYAQRLGPATVDWFRCILQLLRTPMPELAPADAHGRVAVGAAGVPPASATESSAAGAVALAGRETTSAASAPGAEPAETDATSSGDVSALKALPASKPAAKSHNTAACAPPATVAGRLAATGHLLDVMGSTQMRCMLRDGDLCAAGVDYLFALLLQPQPCAAGSSVGTALKSTTPLPSDATAAGCGKGERRRHAADESSSGDRHTRGDLPGSNGGAAKGGARGDFPKRRHDTAAIVETASLLQMSAVLLRPLRDAPPAEPASDSSRGRGGARGGHRGGRGGATRATRQRWRGVLDDLGAAPELDEDGEDARHSAARLHAPAPSRDVALATLDFLLPAAMTLACGSGSIAGAAFAPEARFTRPDAGAARRAAQLIAALAAADARLPGAAQDGAGAGAGGAAAPAGKRPEVEEAGASLTAVVHTAVLSGFRPFAWRTQDETVATNAESSAALKKAATFTGFAQSAQAALHLATLLSLLVAADSAAITAALQRQPALLEACRKPLATHAAFLRRHLSAQELAALLAAVGLTA